MKKDGFPWMVEPPGATNHHFFPTTTKSDTDCEQHFETMVETITIVGIYRGIESFQQKKLDTARKRRTADLGPSFALTVCFAAVDPSKVFKSCGSNLENQLDSHQKSLSPRLLKYSWPWRATLKSQDPDSGRVLVLSIWLKPNPRLSRSNKPN